MGSYSMLPVRVEGLVFRPGDDQDTGIAMALAFLPGTGIDDRPVDSVDLLLVAQDHATALWKFANQQPGSIRNTWSRTPGVPAGRRSVRTPFGICGFRCTTRVRRPISRTTGWLRT